MNHLFISPFKPKKIIDVKPLSFKIYTFNAGYKKFKDDLLIIIFNNPAKISAVFTKSSTPSAPVIWGKRQYKKGYCKVLIVNSGNANAFTGKEGIHSIYKYSSVAAKIFNCQLNQIFVSSTGVIGEKLDPNPIIRKLKSIKDSKIKNLSHAAKAIMTTDTYPKIVLETITVDNQKVRVYGIAKGSGMIAPNMGTMLAYIFIEVSLTNLELNKILKTNIANSFNSISVDGDTSTNDTVMIFSIQKSKLSISITRSQILKRISFAVNRIMISLAKQIVFDGEGISKAIEVNVSNAKNKSQASRIAFSIAESLLVKTAFYGEDANWGRVIMAIGKKSEKINQSKFILKFGNHIVAQNGKASNKLNEKKLKTYIKKRNIKINLDLKLGKFNKTVWSSDLTKKYIQVNSSYRT